MITVAGRRGRALRPGQETALRRAQARPEGEILVARRASPSMTPFVQYWTNGRSLRPVARHHMRAGTARAPFAQFEKRCPTIGTPRQTSSTSGSSRPIKRCNASERRHRRIGVDLREPRFQVRWPGPVTPVRPSARWSAAAVSHRRRVPADNGDRLTRPLTGGLRLRASVSSTRRASAYRSRNDRVLRHLVDTVADVFAQPSRSFRVPVESALRRPADYNARALGPDRRSTLSQLGGVNRPSRYRLDHAGMTEQTHPAFEAVGNVHCPRSSATAPCRARVFK